MLQHSKQAIFRLHFVNAPGVAKFPIAHAIPDGTTSAHPPIHPPIRPSAHQMAEFAYQSLRLPILISEAPHKPLHNIDFDLMFAGFVLNLCMEFTQLPITSHNQNSPLWQAN